MVAGHALLDLSWLVTDAQLYAWGCVGYPVPVQHRSRESSVTEGQGTFESDASPKCHRIEAGAVMTLFPGVWHRYAPDPKTGWVEQWIECCGSAFDRARNANLLRPEQPVLEVGLPSGLLQAFERCHALANNVPLVFRPCSGTDHGAPLGQEYREAGINGAFHLFRFAAPALLTARLGSP
jgi:AraC-like ligand binding domain